MHAFIIILLQLEHIENTRKERPGPEIEIVQATTYFLLIMSTQKLIRTWKNTHFFHMGIRLGSYFILSTWFFQTKNPNK